MRMTTGDEMRLKDYDKQRTAMKATEQGDPCASNRIPQDVAVAGLCCTSFGCSISSTCTSPFGHVTFRKPVARAS